MKCSSSILLLASLVTALTMQRELTGDERVSTESPAEQAAKNVQFYEDVVRPLLKQKCVSCHGALKQEAGLRLDTASLARAGSESGPVLDLDSATDSLLIDRVTADEDERMPPEGERLTESQIQILKRWIHAGAVGPADEVAAADPSQHWSLQPISRPPVPSDVGAVVPSDVGSEGNPHPIDAFVRARLAERGLVSAGLADHRTLLRRMFLDLHGLPPTTEDVQVWGARFQAATSPEMVKDVRVALVDHLLASPRYGERQAQHWLDVVRYADTHGFEVNTPRPNAWHYRDYVIRAFNHDVPYDQFIREQIAGDAWNADTATGFLVAAPVLLPGQIGADDASKRLARQDSLDEIIVGTSATFLGLTVGCARCHDHKFDPITQRDYYAFQGFFAGVRYGDRAIDDESRREKLAEAEKLQEDIDQLTLALRKIEPKAWAGRTIILDDEDELRTTHLLMKNGHGTNPGGTGRGYKDDPGSQVRLPNISESRYTWWPNRPGSDVFTYDPSVSGKFRVWLSWGVHGSGVHTRDAKYVLDVDGDLETRNDQVELASVDQYYFAGVSDGTSEKKPLWSGLLDVGVHPFTKSTRLILRGGDTGTGITADVVVLQEQLGTSNSPTELPSIRSAADYALNVERFEPTEAKYVRFTTLETVDKNRHEPCIDELEVFATATSTENLALATSGVFATSSGNLSETGKHQLKHVNDGQYGNSRSWISNEKGGGWVQLEFPEVTRISRLEWARDRQGQFKDRLPTRYEIAVSTDGTSWTIVASHGDRQPMGSPFEYSAYVRRTAGEQSNAPTFDVEEAVDRLEQLTERQSVLREPTMAYAGVFGTPDKTHLLQRGDPEQPLEQLQPAVPAVLGSLSLAVDSSDQVRRRQLADWVASNENPLTARVMVNRIWLSHFGRGIVDTPSDFGLNGAKPSHPKLLDWLASEFIESNWSIKSLHKTIMTSETYAQSALVVPASVAVDADNRLLWRYEPRRLEGEAIRDGMLQVAGKLNLKMYGAGFDFFKTRGGLSGFPPVDQFGPDRLRRMIYAHKIRMERVPVFGAFDCPDAGQPTPKRTRSTTPIQALNLFNSPFVIDQADSFAERLRHEASDVERQIELAFIHCYGRPCDQEERKLAREVVLEYDLSVLCRALFNSNEFLFLP